LGFKKFKLDVANSMGAFALTSSNKNKIQIKNDSIYIIHTRPVGKPRTSWEDVWRATSQILVIVVWGTRAEDREEERPGR